MNAFHGVFCRIEGVGDAMLGRDTDWTARVIENSFRLHRNVPPHVMVLVRQPEFGTE
jgi:hypothetical protein